MDCSPALRAGLAARVGFIGHQQVAHGEQIVNHEHAFSCISIAAESPLRQITALPRCQVDQMHSATPLTRVAASCTMDVPAT
jgi:hypothetical protein